MKRFLHDYGFILLGLWWIFFIIYLGPLLISAANTELVVLGFVLLGASTYASIRALNYHLNNGKPQ